MKEQLQIPKEITLTSEGNKIKIDGPMGTYEKTINSKYVDFTINENNVIFETRNEKKQALSEIKTVKSIINNLLLGIVKKFVYKMKIVYSHFPMSVKIQGNKLLISNFLGEKAIRTIEIPSIVNCEVKGKEIIVSSIDKEIVGTFAGNVEKRARVYNKDNRIFQDGIYIIKKGVQDE